MHGKGLLFWFQSEIQPIEEFEIGLMGRGNIEIGKIGT